MSDLDDRVLLDDDDFPKSEVELAADLWPVRGQPGCYRSRQGGTVLNGVLVPGSHEQVAFLQYLRNGNHPSVACELMGLKENSLKKWRALGAMHVDWLEAGSIGPDPAVARATDSFVNLCAYLVLEMRKAEAKGEAVLVDVWHAGATDGNWRAARDFLARRWPERWREQKESISTGDRGFGVPGSVAAPPDLAKIIAALREAGVTSDDLAIETTATEAERALPSGHEEPPTS